MIFIIILWSNRRANFKEIIKKFGQAGAKISATHWRRES